MELRRRGFNQNHTKFEVVNDAAPCQVGLGLCAKTRVPTKKMNELKLVKRGFLDPT